MITVHHSDCVDWLANYDGPLFDAVVTDPPYHLTSIVNRFGKDGAVPSKKRVKPNATGAFARASKGFMGQKWDGGDVAFRPETWAAIYDKMKPGAHLVAFSGTRTYHRMAAAIEQAGFEVRDMLSWLYGTGFPKSHDVSKKAGEEWKGWGTALKPACEPICLARKPLAEKTVAANVLAHGTGGLNIDGCRIASDDIGPIFVRGMKGEHRSNYDLGGSLRTGGMRVMHRHPANIVHDGSDEVLAAFPPAINRDGSTTEEKAGSTARFFYSAKAGPLDRIGSAHPTVKPVGLMRWLCRLITPPGGLILDPFAGSGTTGIAAMAEAFDCQMIDIEAAHVADIERKLAYLRGEGSATIIEHNHARETDKGAPISEGLFA